MLLATADKYTAPVDYGFGPLTITVDSEGDILARCEEVDITLGGGFGPYKLGEPVMQQSKEGTRDWRSTSCKEESDADVAIIVQYLSMQRTEAYQSSSRLTRLLFGKQQ